MCSGCITSINDPLPTMLSFMMLRQRLVFIFQRTDIAVEY